MREADRRGVGHFANAYSDHLTQSPIHSLASAFFSSMELIQFIPHNRCPESSRASKKTTSIVLHSEFLAIAAFKSMNIPILGVRMGESVATGQIRMLHAASCLGLEASGMGPY